MAAGGEKKDLSLLKLKHYRIKFGKIMRTRKTFFFFFFFNVKGKYKIATRTKERR